MAEPAAAAAEAEAGVLRSLLEEEEDPPGSGADVSLMAKDSAVAQIDVNAMVAQQHAAAHQARAAAALEEADAVEERHHQDQQQHQQQYHPHDATSQLQHQVAIASTPPPIVTQDLPQPITSQTTPIAIPSSTPDLENETSLTPGSQDLTLSSVPPPTICLCQQPARIPRPRNGGTSCQFIDFNCSFLFKDSIVSLSFFVIAGRGGGGRITGFIKHGLKLIFQFPIQSFHSLPPTQPSGGRRPAPRQTKPGNLKDNRRNVAGEPTGD